MGECIYISNMAIDMFDEHFGLHITLQILPIQHATSIIML